MTTEQLIEQLSNTPLSTQKIELIQFILNMDEQKTLSAIYTRSEHFEQPSLMVFANDDLSARVGTTLELQALLDAPAASGFTPEEESPQSDKLEMTSSGDPAQDTLVQAALWAMMSTLHITDTERIVYLGGMNHDANTAGESPSRVVLIATGTASTEQVMRAAREMSTASQVYQAETGPFQA